MNAPRRPQRRAMTGLGGVGALLLVLLLGWLWTPDLDRATLEARYADSPQDFVEVDGIRLHLRDSGPRDAPVLVLLHGFGSSLHTWQAWADALSADYRVIRYDQPGAGLSAPDPGGDYSDERGLQVLAALMDRLGVPRATLIGHSMGGRLAWRFAADAPQRVERLVLVAPDGFASPGFAYGRAPEVGWSVKLIRQVMPKALLRSSLAAAYADPARLSDAAVDRYHDLLRAPGARDAVIARMRQLVLQEPTPFLQRIRAPTLLLWGAQDAMIPLANAADYLRTLPDARLVTLPGVGHLPQEEAPAASLAALQDFLRR
jgi:pimeloyl-ACP methyl ester carboxylesterase